MQEIEIERGMSKTELLPVVKSTDLETEDYSDLECFRIHKIMSRYDISWVGAVDLLSQCKNCKNDQNCAIGTHYKCVQKRKEYTYKKPETVWRGLMANLPKTPKPPKLAKPPKEPKPLKLPRVTKVDHHVLYFALKKSNFPQFYIAKEFGINQSLVSYIQNRGNRLGWDLGDEAEIMSKVCARCKNEYRCIGGSGFVCPFGKKKYGDEPPAPIPREKRAPIFRVKKVDQKEVYSAIKLSLGNGGTTASVSHQFGISTTYVWRIKQKGDAEGW